MKLCRKCGNILVVGENWRESQKRCYNNICNLCISIEQKKKKIENNNRRKIWREANPQKVKEQQQRDKPGQALYKFKNRAKATALQAERRARKRKATVQWANLNIIEMYYKFARILCSNTGQKWQVDHIIPLQGKTVSGLHHEDNLQIILAIENQRKKNKF